MCKVTPVASAGLREQSIELDCRKLGIPIARHLLRRAHGPHEGRVGPPPIDPIPQPLHDFGPEIKVSDDVLHHVEAVERH